MKHVIAMAALCCALPAAAAELKPFSVHDLVMLERVSDPRLSPDGRYLAYQLRQTDLPANKGVNGVWLLDLSVKKPEPRRLTAQGVESNTPRWSAEGALYFASMRSGSRQVWRLNLAGGEAVPVTALPLDVAAFALSPDGRALALSLDVFPDCANLACTRERLDAAGKSKASGRVYDRLFVRHWDTWKDGTRGQLFYAPLTDGKVTGEPKRVSVGVDGDVPSKPFGGDEEFTFTADGKYLVFTARIAGKTEAWSTNLDLWRAPVDGAAKPENLTAANPATDTGPAVSPDGRTLAYRAMSRAGFEADRYRILLRDLATGATRELAADWPLSAAALQWSPDGRWLYASADELGQHKLFLIDARSGKFKRLTEAGSVIAYAAGERDVFYALDTLGAPAQLFRQRAKGGATAQLTQHNAALLAQRALGSYEQFQFAGWNNETVYGYVMKPAGFAEGKKYPVAFIVHGGPQGSMGNHWHYRWNPQTYAGAGYAAVFIDFHGSTGYGQAFTDSISRDWGGKPLEDLQKGWAHALKTYPFLDGGKACALGASYGGYMVNWIAGNWPEGFQCLVSHDGIFDNRSMYYSTEELWFPEWEHGGPAFVAPENYEKHNPVNHVGKWKTPTLVIHGGNDYRVPLEQGLSTFTALQRRGIESRFLHLPNENHWVLKPQNSIQWHQTVEGWLNRWLK